MKPKRKLYRNLNEETMKVLALLSTCHASLFAFLFLHGRRVYEIVNLKCKDANIKQGTLTMCSPNGRIEVIPLHCVCRLTVAERLRIALPHEYLFVDDKGNQYDASSVRKIWQNAREALGLPPMRLQEAIRSFGMNLLIAGMRTDAITALMGHHFMRE